MYFWNVLRNLLTFWKLPAPVNILIPLVFLGALLLQRRLLRRAGRRGRWFCILSAAAVLAIDVSLSLIRSYVALLVVVGMHFVAAVFLGAVVGLLLCKFQAKARPS